MVPVSTVCSSCRLRSLSFRWNSSTKQDHAADHRNDDDEITDPGEERRERLAIHIGQLQEQNRGHRANQPEHELDREKHNPVPRKRTRIIEAATGDLKGNENVAHR